MLRSTCQASIGLVLLFISIPLTLAQTTMTYQGQLQEGANLVDGETVELLFELYDDPDPAVGTLVSTSGPFTVAVEDGLFQVDLDFGDVNYTVAKYLRIQVNGTWLAETQEITSVPVAQYALGAGGVQWTNVLNAPEFWRLGGNSGSDPTIHFVGTNDAVALEIGVNSERAIRIEPAPSSGHAPNIIAGHLNNGSTARGATIGGGGTDTDPNLVQADYGVIGGGFGNVVTNSRATIAGGADNSAGGGGSTIGGGRFNEIDDSVTVTIAGGLQNSASGSSSVISGGWRNKTGDSLSVVPGGQENEARARYSFAGGYNAIVQADHRGAFVWADDVNQLSVIASDRGEPFLSQVANEFAVRATGGFRFVSDIDDQGDAVQSLHFNPAGRLGVNTDGQLAALHVESATEEDPLRVRVDGFTGLLVEDDRGVSVGSASAAPARGLRVHGELELNTLGAGGSIGLCLTNSGIVSECGTSARRFKEDIQPLKTAGALIDRLRAVRFSWKETGEADIGLIAEEVAAVEPHLVNYGADGEIRGVKYRHLTAVLVRALQEQSGQISESRDRLAALEAENVALRELADRNRELEQRLAALEAMLLDDKQAALTD